MKNCGHKNIFIVQGQKISLFFSMMHLTRFPYIAFGIVLQNKTILYARHCRIMPSNCFLFYLCQLNPITDVFFITENDFTGTLLGGSNEYVGYEENAVFGSFQSDQSPCPFT